MMDYNKSMETISKNGEYFPGVTSTLDLCTRVFRPASNPCTPFGQISCYFFIQWKIRKERQYVYR